MKTIKLAPSYEEVEVTTSTIVTDFGGRHIVYALPSTIEFDLPRQKDMAIEVMRKAIALSSYPHQLQWLLNQSFNVEGKVYDRAL